MAGEPPNCHGTDTKERSDRGQRNRETLREIGCKFERESERRKQSDKKTTRGEELVGIKARSTKI